MAENDGYSSKSVVTSLFAALDWLFRYFLFYRVCRVQPVLTAYPSLTFTISHSLFLSFSFFVALSFPLPILLCLSLFHNQHFSAKVRHVHCLDIGIKVPDPLPHTALWHCDSCAQVPYGLMGEVDGGCYDHTVCLSLSPSLSHSLAPSISLSPTPYLALSRSHTNSLSLFLSYPLSLSPLLSLSLSYTHTYTARWHTFGIGYWDRGEDLYLESVPFLYLF
jgi:hypothetical protein